MCRIFRQLIIATYNMSHRVQSRPYSNDGVCAHTLVYNDIYKVNDNTPIYNTKNIIFETDDMLPSSTIFNNENDVISTGIHQAPVAEPMDLIDSAFDT